MNAAASVVALCAVMFLLCVSADAQQSKRIYRIGYLESGPASGSAHLLKAFRKGLGNLGYIEGQNLVIEYRYGEGKPGRRPQLAEELVRLKVDVIVVRATDDALAAEKATRTIPIVMTSVGNPVDAGLVVSLARPGGNVTGLAQLTPELGGKRLEILKEVVPKLSRIAVLKVSGITSGGQLQLKEITAAMTVLGMKFQLLEVGSNDEFDSTFQAASSGRADALIVMAAPSLFAERRLIAELAAKRRLPTMYPQAEYVDAGGLMSYGINLADLYFRAATYVDKILKGSKPGDLPVEQPKKFEFVINLKAAKQIDLTIPPNVLARADQVIR